MTRKKKEKEESFVFVLVQGKVEGREYWAYARTLPEGFARLTEARKTGSFNLHDFACEILAEGEGAVPPEKIRKKMEKEQAINHEFEKEFNDLLDVAACLAEGKDIKNT